MQTLICQQCLESDSLCDICKQRMAIDRITQIEVEVSRFLFNLSKKVKTLEDISIEKVINANTIIIISGNGDGPRLVGKGGTIVKALAKKFGKSIRIIEKTKDYKQFIQCVIAPSTLKAVNTIYTPTGEKYKLRIKNLDKNSTLNEEDIIDLSLAIFNKKVEIVFEN